MRKKLITTLCCLFITHILVWCAGFRYGISIDKRSGINEIRTDIQRARDVESRVIKQLDTIESRLGASAEEAKELSTEVGGVSQGIDVVRERISRSQETLRAKSELIEEGSGIIRNIKERGSHIKD